MRRVGVGKGQDKGPDKNVARQLSRALEADCLGFSLPSNVMTLWYNEYWSLFLAPGTKFLKLGIFRVIGMCFVVY